MGLINLGQRQAQRFQPLNQRLGQHGVSAAPAPASGLDTDRSSVSPQARLLPQLGLMLASSPDAYRRLMARVADKLKERADAAPPGEYDRYRQAADAFRSAADSGKLPDLSSPSRTTHRRADSYDPLSDFLDPIRDRIADVIAQELDAGY